MTGDPCPVGSELCDCTDGGACDPGLVCVVGTCIDEDCSLGAQGCPCTLGGGCDGDLVCDDGLCTPSDPTEGSLSASSAADSTGSGEADTSTQESGTDTGEPADLDDWTKRRPVLITNPNDADMVDHQVKVDLDWDDDMAPEMIDLRFTDADGVLLPHWIESTLAPVSGRVWVRVPLVPANDETTIDMWYGNPTAPDASDGESTFDLWEDFEEDLDETIWSAPDGYAIANGRITITTGAVISNVPIVALPGLMIEIRARWIGDTGAGSALTAAESQGAIGDQDLLQISQTPLHMTAVDGAMTVANDNWTNPPGEPGDQFEWHGIGLGAGVARFSRTHEYIPNYLWWHDYTADIPNDYYLWLGHVYGALGEGEATLQTEIDVLLARKFSELPAETSVGGENDV